MALSSLLLDVCVTMVCVLGSTRCSDGDQNECPCSGIPRWPLTEPPPEDCHQLNRTFRYTCLKGYVRTAGTSNLIKCKPGSSRWSNPTLKCKLDPRGATHDAPDSTDAAEPALDLERNSPTRDAVTGNVEKNTTLEPTHSLRNGLHDNASLLADGSYMGGPGTTTIAVVSGVSIAVVALVGIGLLLHKMHELWAMTERTRSRIQAAEMSFLRRVSGLSLRDRVRSSVIREGLKCRTAAPPH
ncbi:interleukin-15 receptor subunit alpha isoform X2 [Syngnathoides biaculeatus]|uniref:interleukin-15 receptor subunit alpha isoform X2 n=1 Tax=Syngnathoides biaculeatus TaxID=300417 RepID=UPI002ADE1B20|nr:interleukin-15 receptor subunit alpha isoform X2 [Syngnathoides biaculeatus]